MQKGSSRCQPHIRVVAQPIDRQIVCSSLLHAGSTENVIIGRLRGAIKIATSDFHCKSVAQAIGESMHLGPAGTGTLNCRWLAFNLYQETWSAFVLY